MYPNRARAFICRSKIVYSSGNNLDQILILMIKAK